MQATSNTSSLFEDSRTIPAGVRIAGEHFGRNPAALLATGDSESRSKDRHLDHSHRAERASCSIKHLSAPPELEYSGVAPTQ